MRKKMSDIKSKYVKIQILKQKGNIAFILDQTNNQYMVIEIVGAIGISETTNEASYKKGYMPLYTGKIEDKQKVEKFFNFKTIK